MPAYPSDPPSRGGKPRSKPQRTPTLAEMDMGLGETEPYRPLRRPPVAFLCIQDSGPNEGDWIRLRDERIVIGRTEGDIRIPHDRLLSTPHAELVRTLYKDAWVWVLTDQQSTNGSYARVSKSPLDPGQEIVIGSTRFRFDSPLDRNTPSTPAKEEEEEEHLSTWRWSGKTTRLAPYLVELTEQGEGKHFDLMPAENWIGRDARKCSVVVNDPMIDHQHARIHREPTRRWHIQDRGTTNGTWVRVEQFRIKQNAQFQLGEQRFLLKIGQ